MEASASMVLVFVRMVTQVKRAQSISMNVDKLQCWVRLARTKVFVLILWPVTSVIASLGSKAIDVKTLRTCAQRARARMGLVA